MHRPLHCLFSAASLTCATLLSACAVVEQAADRPDRREVALAVTMSNRLIRFNAVRPERILSTRALSGLQPEEQVLGIDFRAGNDTLYALGSSGRLYTVDTDSGVVTAVGERFALALQGGAFGFDFNPTVDRIRVVSSDGQNMRLQPDTGAVVDADGGRAGLQIDGALAFAPGDVNAGKPARVVAAAYSYNKVDPKITTNFAIDAATGSLLTQGSREGAQPPVSPNSGRLFTVGPLGAGSFSDASFDIHVLTDRGFAALTSPGARASRWAELDLATGAARVIGSIGGGEPVRALALETW